MYAPLSALLCALSSWCCPLHWKGGAQPEAGTSAACAAAAAATRRGAHTTPAAVQCGAGVRPSCTVPPPQCWPHMQAGRGARQEVACPPWSQGRSRLVAAAHASIKRPPPPWMTSNTGSQGRSQAGTSTSTDFPPQPTLPTPAESGDCSCNHPCTCRPHHTFNVHLPALAASHFSTFSLRLPAAAGMGIWAPAPGAFHIGSKRGSAAMHLGLAAVHATKDPILAARRGWLGLCLCVYHTART